MADDEGQEHSTEVIDVDGIETERKTPLQSAWCRYIEACQRAARAHRANGSVIVLDVDSEQEETATGAVGAQNQRNQDQAQENNQECETADSEAVLIESRSGGPGHPIQTNMQSGMPPQTHANMKDVNARAVPGTSPQMTTQQTSTGPQVEMCVPSRPVAAQSVGVRPGQAARDSVPLDVMKRAVESTWEVGDGVSRDSSRTQACARATSPDNTTGRTANACRKAGDPVQDALRVLEKLELPHKTAFEENGANLRRTEPFVSIADHENNGKGAGEGEVGRDSEPREKGSDAERKLKKQAAHGVSAVEDNSSADSSKTQESMFLPTCGTTDFNGLHERERVFPEQSISTKSRSSVTSRASAERKRHHPQELRVFLESGEYDVFLVHKRQVRHRATGTNTFRGSPREFPGGGKSRCRIDCISLEEMRENRG